jgi:hypothetical protein
MHGPTNPKSKLVLHIDLDYGYIFMVGRVWIYDGSRIIGVSNNDVCKHCDGQIYM